MKKKYLATILGTTLVMSLAVSGCGAAAQSTAENTSTAAEASAEAGAESSEAEVNESDTDSKAAGEDSEKSGKKEDSDKKDSEKSDSEKIYGEITAIGDGTITIKTGTYDKESGELTLTEETQEITVTDETEVAMSHSGKSHDSDSSLGKSGKPDKKSDSAESSDSEETAETESSEAAENAEPQAPADGETPPEMPDGEMPQDGETPPEMPDGEMPQDGETPPEMPSGEMPQDGETPPEMPSGEMPQDGETPPEMPSGEMPSDGQMPSDTEQSDELTLASLKEGDQIKITLNEDGTAKKISILSGKSSGADSGMGQMPGGMPGSGNEQGGPGSSDGTGGGPGGNGQGGPGGAPGGSASTPDSYDAAQEYSGDVVETGKTIASTGTDENAVLVTSGTVELSDMTISRDSDDSTGGDSSSFYGVGAAALVTDGTLIISDSTIESDAAGGAGVFAYGDGTAYVSNTTIRTEQGTSGGIHVAGGGTLYAYDLDVETNGGSAAAVRSDRGGGTMVVDEGTYVSNGSGSPAVYSTADITIHGADLEATGSEAVCIEGLNTLRLYDTNLTGNMPDQDQNDCTWNVILYQSMSGDSEVGNSTFEMVGGSLTAKNGGMFYTTNTESTFILEDVDITYADENDFFLKCTGNANSRGWGSTGSNGADSNFTAIDQEMEGNVIWDSISELDFYMTDGSTLTGAFIDDETNAGNGGSGFANLYISEDSTWVVTEDSTLTNLYNAGTVQDADGNTVTIQGTDGTVYVEGTGSVTVTVTSYSDTADLSGASESGSFSDYAVEMPA